MSDQWLEFAKEAMKLPGLLPETYSDLLKPGVKQVGQALETAVGLCNTFLSPITWANERTRIALKRNLDKYRSEIEHLPEEKISDVPPEVGIPIMEKFVYVTDEELSNLYVNLLAKASCFDTAQYAHPSFVNIINSLSPDEAALLKEMHRQGALAFLTATTSFTEALSYGKVSGVRFLDDLLTGVEARIQLSFPKNINAYFSNFEGLGLIKIRRDLQIIQEGSYESLETFYRSVLENLDYDRGKQIARFERGKIQITPFGGLFLTACLTKLRQS
jgi:hypothetical protein